MKPEDREQQYEQQNAWIVQQHKAWQLAWHAIFDDDDALRADPEYDRPEDIPDDIDTDYRLVFGLCNATPATWRKCFALFPRGDEMARRFASFVNDDVQLSETQARALVRDMGARIDAAFPSSAEEIDWTSVTLADRASPDANRLLQGSGRISELIEEPARSLHAPEDLPSVAARLFLSEPLYAAAGNYYELRDWITGATLDARRDEIYGMIYRLWQGGWQPLVSDQVILLRR